MKKNNYLSKTSTVDSYGRTFLINTIIFGKKALALRLIGKYKNLNARDNFGKSALSYAVYQGDVNLTIKLINQYVDTADELFDGINILRYIDKLIGINFTGAKCQNLSANFFRDNDDFSDFRHASRIDYNRELVQNRYNKFLIIRNKKARLVANYKKIKTHILQLQSSLKYQLFYAIVKKDYDKILVVSKHIMSDNFSQNECEKIFKTNDAQGFSDLLIKIIEFYKHISFDTALENKFDKKKKITSLRDTINNKKFVELINLIAYKTLSSDLRKNDNVLKLMEIVKIGFQNLIFPWVTFQIKDLSAAQLNAVDHKGNTALIYAAKLGLEKVVVALLDKKVDAEHSNKKGVNALMLAAFYNNLATVKILMPSSLKVLNKQDNQGGTALIYAANSGHCEVIAILAGSDQLDLEVTCNRGFSALRHAINAKRVEIVKHPEFFCVDILSQDFKGETALSSASGNLAKYLLSSLAYTLFNAELSQLIVGNNNKAARSFIKRGKELENLDEYSRTPFMIALILKNDYVASRLLLKTTNIKFQDNFGNTPLMYAVKARNIKMVSLLILKKRADINLANKKGISPLEFARSRNLKQKGFDKIFEILEISNKKIIFDQVTIFAASDKQIEASTIPTYK